MTDKNNKLLKLPNIDRNLFLALRLVTKKKGIKIYEYIKEAIIEKLERDNIEIKPEDN